MIDDAWPKIMEPQLPGNFSRPGPEAVERKDVAKNATAQRVPGRTVQSKMKSVLGRMTIGAA